MANDYSLIGSFALSGPRFLSIERMPIGIVNRVSEVDQLKNLEETDIDFMESLYRNSNPDYYMGGWIVKAVCDVVLEFMCGKLPKVNANDDEYTKFCNKVWNQNASKLYGAFRELGLFGQEWIYIGWDNRTQLPRYRPLCKRNVVDVRYENFDDPDDITYIRIRDTFSDYSTIVEKGEEIDNMTEADVLDKVIMYDKIFWKELNPEYTKYVNEQAVLDAIVGDGKAKRSRRKANTTKEPPEQWLYFMRILKRDDEAGWTEYQPKTVNPLGVIPVVEFNQNRLSMDKSGYSDVSGALKVIGVYHQMLESSVNNNLYNMQPTLKFTGIEGDPVSFVQKMYGSADIDTGDVLEQEGTYGLYGSYYLPQGMDVNWLSTPDHTGSSDTVLQKIFYVLVQVTGVPEWALGASITGAWATVKQQAIPLMQKIHAKRMDVNDSLLTLCWISAKVMQFHKPMEDYIFEDMDAEIMWDDVLTRDTSEALSIIESLLGRNLITEETALSLIGVVSDPVRELELVREAKQKQQDENRKDAEAFANEQINSKVLDLFKSQQQTILDDEDANPELKKAAGEMLSLSDGAILHILNAMVTDNMFDKK